MLNFWLSSLIFWLQKTLEFCYPGDDGVTQHSAVGNVGKKNFSLAQIAVGLSNILLNFLVPC